MGSIANVQSFINYVEDVGCLEIIVDQNKVYFNGHHDIPKIVYISYRDDFKIIGGLDLYFDCPCEYSPKHQYTSVVSHHSIHHILANEEKKGERRIDPPRINKQKERTECQDQELISNNRSTKNKQTKGKRRIYKTNK